MKTSKKNFLIIMVGALLYCTYLSAQVSQFAGSSYDIRKKSTLLDSAQYLFNYKLTFITDTVKKDSLYNNLCLLVGPKYSKFFDGLYLDENFIKKYQNLPITKDYLTKDGKGLASTEVYKNLEKKLMTVTVLVYKSPYTYEDKYNPQSWKIEKEKKKLLGYTCQKATTSYLGRNYTAWFAPEIPIPNGPWKFGGLPGLILQVADDTGQYTFDCVEIKQLTEKLPIVRYKADYIKIDRKSLNKMIKKLHTQFIETFRAMLPPNTTQQFVSIDGAGNRTIITISNNDNIENSSGIKFPYNPIELE